MPHAKTVKSSYLPAEIPTAGGHCGSKMATSGMFKNRNTGRNCKEAGLIFWGRRKLRVFLLVSAEVFTTLSTQTSASKNDIFFFNE